jgi:hypothetical protein
VVAFFLRHPVYDMVWKPFVLGDCVPCAGSRLKNPLSFYCLTIVSSGSLAKGSRAIQGVPKKPKTIEINVLLEFE